MTQPIIQKLASGHRVGALSVKDELRQILFTQDDEVPTERTKRARKDATKKPTGTPTQPDKMKELFEKMKKATKEAGSRKLSARDQLNTILFGPGDKILKGAKRAADGWLTLPKSSPLGAAFIPPHTESAFRKSARSFRKQTDLPGTAEGIASGGREMKRIRDEFATLIHNRRGYARWTEGGPLTKMSAAEELNHILLSTDPRPRDQQGQFKDANGEDISPEAMSVVYGQPQPQHPEETSALRALMAKLKTQRAA